MTSKKRKADVPTGPLLQKSEGAPVPPGFGKWRPDNLIVIPEGLLDSLKLEVAERSKLESQLLLHMLKTQLAHESAVEVVLVLMRDGFNQRDLSTAPELEYIITWTSMLGFLSDFIQGLGHTKKTQSLLLNNVVPLLIERVFGPQGMPLLTKPMTARSLARSNVAGTVSKEDTKVKGKTRGRSSK